MKKENSFLLVNRPLVFQKLDPYDKNQCELYKKKTRIHLDSLCVFNQATTIQTCTIILPIYSGLLINQTNFNSRKQTFHIKANFNTPFFLRLCNCSPYPQYFWTGQCQLEHDTLWYMVRVCICHLIEIEVIFPINKTIRLFQLLAIRSVY